MEKDKPLIDLETLKSLKESRQDSRETQAALEAIELTGNIVDALMNGRQIDIAFYSLYANKSIKKIKKSRIQNRGGNDK